MAEFLARKGALEAWLPQIPRGAALVNDQVTILRKTRFSRRNFSSYRVFWGGGQLFSVMPFWLRCLAVIGLMVSLFGTTPKGYGSANGGDEAA